MTINTTLPVKLWWYQGNQNWQILASYSSKQNAESAAKQYHLPPGYYRIMVDA